MQRKGVSNGLAPFVYIVQIISFLLCSGGLCSGGLKG